MTSLMMQEDEDKIKFITTKEITAQKKKYVRRVYNSSVNQESMNCLSSDNAYPQKVLSIIC